MDSRWLGVIVLIIILGVGGWYVFSHPVTPAPVTEETPIVTESATTTEEAIPAGPVTVMYTSTGFSPGSVSIAEGQTVKWINQSSGEMWVAAAVHPTHMAYDGTTKNAHCAVGYTGTIPFDACESVGPGESYSFTFTKADTWKYHDHVHATMFGTVVVTATPATTVTASTSVNVR